MKKLYLLYCIVLLSGITSAQSTLSVSASPNPACAQSTVTISFYDPSAFSYSVTVSGNGFYQTGTVTATTMTVSLPYGGYYYADVWAMGASGGQISYNWASIQVSGPSATPIGSSAPQGSCPNDEVQFYSNGYNFGSGNVVMDWDLGNGTTYTQIPYSSVSSTYTTSGTYIISAVANFPGCGTYSATDTLVVSTSSSSVPTFYSGIYPNDSVCPGDGIQLYGPWTYYLMFDYGDGTFDNNSNGYVQPHAYQTYGTYPVSVTAVNGCGNYYTYYDTVYVQSNLPYSGYPPSIGMGDSIICPNSETYFYPNYGGTPKVLWDFGNNDTTSINNPSRAFTTLGTKVITLTAYNGCGNSMSSTRNLYVVDTISPTSITVSMTDSICPGSPFVVDVQVPGVYNNGGPGGSDDYTYDFGDTLYTGSNSASHFYSTPGNYTVNVSYVNGCGNSISTTVPLYVGSAAGTQPSVFFMSQGGSNSGACPGDTTFCILFPGGGNNTYQVDFGDGSPLAGAPMLLQGPGGFLYYIYKHVYTTAGTYTATCTYSSPCGGQQVTTTTVGISTSATPNDAGFFYDDNKYYCLGDPINFFAYGASTYQWDFGDGSGTLLTTGQLQAVTHTFNEPGYYNVQLIVTNGCGLKDTSTTSINMPDTRINIITNQVASSCGMSDGKAIAIATGGTVPYTYDWTNGDNGFIADSISAGIYVVTVEDKNGCSNYAIATVSDQQAPAILVNNVIDASCSGGNDGVIDISVVGSSGPYTYNWSNGKTTEDINNLVAGPYEITVKDANGCVATKSIYVSEPDPFTVSFTQTMPHCGSAAGALYANVLGNSGPYYFLWSNGANTAANSGIPAGLYDLVVVDSKGCLKNVTAVLNNQGGPAVGIDSVLPLNCNTGGASIYITATGSGLSYSWTNGSNTYNTADIVNIPAGSYSLTVTGSGGCISNRVVDIDAASPEGNPICLVTVDTATYTNKVIWEQVTQPNVASFNIYRESSQAGLYYLVGNVDADSLHQYVDPVADPSVKPWRYKITTVSDCGVESEQSEYHKTIHLTINKGLTDSTYNLIWDDYMGQNGYTTFYVWRYKNTTGWVKLDSLSKIDHSYTDFVNGFSQLTDLYYFVEAGPLNGCDPSRSIINTSRSNIKQIVYTPPPPDTTSGVGIHEQEFADNFSVFPNPSKGQITLIPGRDFGKTRIEITNVLGQVLYAENSVFASTKVIDLTSLANGIYFVRVYRGDRAVAKKIVLSR